MGVGLSGGNALGGTILGAGMAIAKAVNDISDAAEKEKLETEKGLLAKEQFHEANAELTKLEGESEEAGKALEEATTNYDTLMAKNPGGKGNTKAALEEKRGKALTEKEAASRAFNELKERVEAKKALIARTESIMKRTKIIGGNE